MDHEFHNIIEKLAILEGRIIPQENTLAESKQKKPALFTNLKKKDQAEAVDESKVEEDVVGKVKASLADYLKSAEEEIKQDKDLLQKKKQDLDIRKKELKHLDLQQKQKDTAAEQVDEEEPTVLDEESKLNVGDPIIVTAPNEYEGMTGEVVEFSPSGKFVVVTLYNGPEISMHLSDVDYNEYDDDEEVDENTTYAKGGNSTYAQGGNATYASESAPVKTMEFELQEMGGSVLVELHGNERDGFSIRRAGKELSTKFKSLAEAELALEMFAAHRKQQLAADQSADYIEEK